jgi:hypothetical protein
MEVYLSKYLVVIDVHIRSYPTLLVLAYGPNLCPCQLDAPVQKLGNRREIHSDNIRT